LAHKNVPHLQLFQGNLGLVDLKRVNQGFDTVGVWDSNPHAPTNLFNNLTLLASFSVTPNYAIYNRAVLTPDAHFLSLNR